VQTKNSFYDYTFALSPFLFFSFFFSKCEALDHLFCGHHLHHDHHLASPLGLDYLIKITHLDQMLVLGFINYPKLN
jgi:hypothetical protein